MVGFSAAAGQHLHLLGRYGHKVPSRSAENLDSMSSPLIVVSGLPRSGTSLMMAALAAGGLQLITDRTRPPDKHNPRGYFEDSRVLSLDHDAQWLHEQKGKAVKILSHLLRSIPTSVESKVLFMRRPLSQVLASQNAMLGQAKLDRNVAALIGRDLGQTLEWLAEQRHLATLQVSYSKLLENPRDEFRRVLEFLEVDLDLQAMAATVEPSLHRQRT
jgi:hypothetical protein